MADETIEMVGKFLGMLIFYSPWILIPSWVVTRYQLGNLGRSYGIRQSWLTWIPLVNAWIPGSISDAYRRSEKGKKSAKRKLLVALRFLMVILFALFANCVLLGLRKGEVAVSKGAAEAAAEYLLIRGTARGLWFLIPALPLWIAEKVMWYGALYDIFHAFVPKKRVWYLALSLIPVINVITKPICLIDCRNRVESAE